MEQKTNINNVAIELKNVYSISDDGYEALTI